MSHPYSKQPREAYEGCSTKAISAIAATGQPGDVVMQDSCKQRQLGKPMSGHYIVLIQTPIYRTR